MIKHPGNIAISASAGTGKTYRLALRYIELVASGVKPDTIVALTFSRAAANEIFDRVVFLITKWISNPDSFRKENSGTSLKNLTTSDLEKILIQILSSLHRLQVGTIDSFFINILTCFSMEMGLPGGFRIIDEYHQALVRDNVLSSVLHSPLVSESDVENLFEAYRLATIAKEKKSITGSFQKFVQEYHQDFCGTEEILWGDFKGDYPFEASSNILKDIACIVSEIEELKNTGDYSDTFFKDMDSFLAEAYTFYGGKFEKISFLTEKVFPSFDQLKSGTCPIPGYRSSKKTINLSPESSKKLVKIAGYVLNRIFLQNIMQSRGVQNILRQYDQRYISTVRSRGMLTFDDVKWIMGKSKKSFTGDSEYDENRLYIEYRLDSKYNHYLVDEFQDTSRLQWAVLNNLVDEVMQSDTGEKSFFYVGDVKQAIYGWRKGDARLFGELLSKYTDSAYPYPLKRESINRSWRSAPQIIQTINSIFTREKLLSVPGIESGHISRWDWELHETNLSDKEGYVEYVEFEKEGRAVTFDSDKGCNYIHSVLEASKALQKGLSIAILVRSNQKGAEYYNGLKERGIPVDFIGSESGIDSNAVKLIISILTLADSPHDRSALKHVQMSPLGQFFSEKTTYDIANSIREKGFAETVKLWSNLLAQATDLTEFSIIRLQELEEKSRRFDTLGENRVSFWKKYVEEMPSPGTCIGRAVQIMTIHRSKGLQFDIVFLPELRSKNSIVKVDSGSKLLVNNSLDKPWALISPSREIATLDREIAQNIYSLDNDSCNESLCVLYVAMTRAKYGLYMMGNIAPKTSSSVYFETILRHTLSSASSDNRITSSKAGEYIRYANGNSEWHLNFKNVTENSEHQKWIEIKNNPKISASPRVTDVSPSQKEISHFPFGSIFSETGERAVQIGTAVHELFSQIKDISLADIDKITSRFMLNNQYPEHIRTEAVNLFQTCCEDETVRNLLTTTDSQVVFIEKQISAVIDGRMVNGIVDRFVIDFDSSGKPISAFVMDYKTNSVSNDSEIDTASHQYLPQLEIYRKMVSILTGLDVEQIDCGLLFVRPCRYLPLEFGEMAPQV